MPNLSEAALAVLEVAVIGEKPDVDPTNLDAYRELAAAGVMYPVSTWKRGPEAIFRFTEDGWNRRHEFLARTVVSPGAAS